VRQYIDAFNKGDMDGMAATCAVPASILDGMAPHVWQGPTACKDWYRDVLPASEKAQLAILLVSENCDTKMSAGIADMWFRRHDL